MRSLNSQFSMHACAAHQEVECLEVLLDYIPNWIGTVVVADDTDGRTIDELSKLFKTK